jgi:hypothetical protein
MSYLEQVIKASGGFAAPAEVLNEKKIRASLEAAGMLVPEEQDLASALIEIADKYGKFNEDQTGIWADYHEPEDNPYAEMGVKCGNCVLYRGGQECAIVAFKVDPEGYCRFAVLPDGTVDPSKAPEGSKPFEQHELAPIVSDADYGDACPPATQDIVLNIENRQNAIENVGYGPLNPAQPNDVFWQDKAERWNTTVREAKSAVCGNCIFFDRRPKTLDCIESGIAEGGSGDQSAWDAIDQAELGYCTALDFKCAASRTCNAWAAGGPVTEDTVTAASQGPCWDGYVQVGMKKGDGGKMVPNCVPANQATLYATAGSKPAPKKDRIFGSSKNKKGSAAGNKKVTFSKKVEKSLQEKADKHNEKYGDTASKKTSLKTLKAVYRRGAGAFSTSHRPDQNRNSWAMARVNAFLHLLRTGAPKNSNYTTDNDLLPPAHRRSSKSSASITAAAAVDYDSYVDSQLDVSVLSKEDYVTNEHAIYSMAEYSGFGYEIIPSLKASWLRAEKAGEDSFERALELAVNLYESPDSDLLPRMEN